MSDYRVENINYDSKYLQSSQAMIVALPPHFDVNKAYEVYLVFDGKDMISHKMQTILATSANVVLIGFSNINNMIRFNDLTTYTNSDVKVLMTKYFPLLKESVVTTLGGNGTNYLSFISEEALPFIINTFQLKISGYNALGCSLGAYFCLQMLYLANFAFKKMILLSPAIWFNKQIMIDLQQRTLNHNQPLFVTLWVGKKEPKFFEGKIVTNYVENTILLEQVLHSCAISTELVIADHSSHGFKWWIKFINDHHLLVA